MVPSPYVPTESVCLAFQARKSGECMDAVVAVISALPPEAGASMAAAATTPLHLDAQCQCVPERRAAISSCVSAPDCEAFARCAVPLTRDGWQPGG